MDTEPGSVNRNTVAIRDVCKTYDGKQWVLSGLNMTVREGTIYGLLGSSGCGKTTILNAIIGLMGLDSGTIELSIRNKCDVGFMPQTVSLYDQLTLEEQLNYYGTVYGMDADRKRSRLDLMFKVLQLPCRDLRPPQLSGGERRRVSLAIALLHDPKLLILDEPTVGVDPLLRESIWEFLKDFIRSGGKTIIMTTHYIDEARQTNTVGLMRNGVMLCEKPPELIVKDCGVDNIEEAFLRLAQRQEQESSDIIQKSPEIENKNSIYSPLSRESHVFTMSRFQEEVKKNLFFIWRNLHVAIFVLIIPSFCCLLSYYTCGRYPEGLKLGVVNQDFPFGSQNCDFHGNQLNNCTLKYLSCGYLEKLRKTTLTFIDYGNVDEALEGMKVSNLWGVLYFSTDFTNAMSLRIQEPLINDDAVVDNSTVFTFLDAANKVAYDVIKFDLIKSWFSLMKEVAAGCNLPVNLVKPPVKFEKPIFGRRELNNWNLMGPGILCFLVLCMPLTYGGITLIEEKNCGAITRTLVAGCTYFEIFTAHTVIQLGIQMFILITSMMVVFSVSELHFQQPLLCVILLTLLGLVGIFMAMTLAITIDSVLFYTFCVTGILIATTVLGGIMWPCEGIHYLLTPISLAFPIRLPLEALHSLMKRGWDLSNNQIILGFSIPILYIILFTTINVIYIKRHKATLFVAKNTQ